MMYPWLWPELLASMNRHRNFTFKFFRQYQTHIFDFEVIDNGKDKRQQWQTQQQRQEWQQNTLRATDASTNNKL